MHTPVFVFMMSQNNSFFIFKNNLDQLVILIGRIQRNVMLVHILRKLALCHLRLKKAHICLRRLTISFLFAVENHTVPLVLECSISFFLYTKCQEQCFQFLRRQVILLGNRPEERFSSRRGSFDLFCSLLWLTRRSEKI